MGIHISEANQFIGLHAHPQAVNSNDLRLINDWIIKYPYCQTLHILATTVFKQDAENEDYLAKAATFASNREVLFHFINHIEDFETAQVVLDESLNQDNSIEEIIESKNDMGQAFGANLNYYKVDEAKQDDEEKEPVAESESRTHEVVVEAENDENVIADESIGGVFLEEEIQIEEPAKETTDEHIAEETVVEVEEIEIEEPIQQDEDIEEAVAEESMEKTDNEEELSEEEIQKEEPVQETVGENVAEEIAVDEEEIQTEEPIQQDEYIEETVIEESVQEVVNEEDLAAQQIQTEEPVQQTNEEETELEESVQEQGNTEEALADEEVGEIVDEEKEIAASEEETEVEEPAQQEKPVEPANEEEIDGSVVSEEKNEPKPEEKDELVFESPIASDFFAFAKAEKPVPLDSNLEAAPNAAAVRSQEKTKEEVSQYNDERMPYTFLWWLNKTRKEHANNTQPYVKAVSPTPVKEKIQAEPNLNHQIAENIFHLRGAEEIAKTAGQNQTIPFDFRRKEFQIIEKFIKEEPQIKPPAPNKIDSENKAKKSSEDANQVVSETLAKIYVEQMLYHKALDVYKKLSLKYPEKSTYFASQIKYLELKVN